MKAPKMPSGDFFYHVEAVHDNGLDIRSRTIFVEPGDGDEGIDESTAARFLKNLSILESLSDEEITIELVTCGGLWDYGMAMFDAVSASPCYITTISYAHARSMSSIIPQAADHRIIMPNCYFMMHWGTDGYSGVMHGLMAYAENSEAAKRTMLEIYYSRCQYSELYAGLDKAKVIEYLAEKMNRKVEWFMTAQDAVNHGFMDEVGESFSR